ncbi:MAG: HAMP domain-containing protein [Methylococcaceae bacterium]|nr:HAMP domain-containing protein [Methylococcaceae bacterium]
MGAWLCVRAGRGRVMRLFPRSMLGRTGLLIALVLVLTQAGSLMLFSKLRQDARPREIVARVIEVVDRLQRTAAQAEPEARRAALQGIAEEFDVRLFREGEVTVPALNLNRPLLGRLEERLRRRLGAAAKVGFQAGSGGTLWIGMTLAGQPHWLVFPRQGQGLQDSDDWLLWLGLLLVIALAAAYLIVAHVSRPIRALADAAERIAQGDPGAVAETGPEETRVLARSFNRMAENLRRAEADRTLLLAGVSHDLRTPLARLRLGLELLPAGDDRLKGEMERDIVSMDEILGQFLSFVRGQDSEAVRADCNLAALVREVLEHYAGREPPVLFSGPETLKLALRPVAVRRLLTNLIDNAYRYGAPPIRVALEAQGDDVVLSVSDGGKGIPEAELARVLEPFQRLDSGSGGHGVGLGLAIADRIARLHGGRLRLGNRPEGGLRVEVGLPRGRLGSSGA